MNVEIEIPEPPEGWVFDGYRCASTGEKIFDGRKWEENCRASGVTARRYPVAVKAKPKWRPAILDHLAPFHWLAIDTDGSTYISCGGKPIYRNMPGIGAGWQFPDGCMRIGLSEPIQLRGPEACWPTGPVES